LQDSQRFAIRRLSALPIGTDTSTDAITDTGAQAMHCGDSWSKLSGTVRREREERHCDLP